MAYEELSSHTITHFPNILVRQKVKVANGGTGEKQRYSCTNNQG